MTPVEERIDHEGDEIGSTTETNPAEIAAMAMAGLVIREVEVETLGRAYLDLLTEHSAREEALRKALEYALEWSTDEDGAPAVAWRNVAREALALPATESAQPEEELDEPPEGYIVPEGDERCSFTMDACTCMKRKGHDGLHACVHGGWRDEGADPGVR